jgi:hypothetical protein
VTRCVLALTIGAAVLITATVYAALVAGSRADDLMADLEEAERLADERRGR